MAGSDSTQQQGATSDTSSTSPANSQDLIWQEIQRVKAEIAQTTAASQQTDSQGDLTYDAMKAKKNLASLQSDYRQLLSAYSSSTKTSTSTVSGKPTDQYIIVKQPDGSITYEANPNYQPPQRIVAGGTQSDRYIITQSPDGTLHQSENPNYNPTTQNLEQAKFAWQQAQASIANQLALGKLSLDQASQQLQAQHDQITAQLQNQMDTEKYAESLQKDLFSPSGMTNFNGSLGALAKDAGVPFTPVAGVSPSLPVQLAQQALSSANPQLAASIGQATLPGTGGKPASGGPASPAPSPAYIPPPGPAAAPVGSAYVAPSPRPLSPINQQIQQGLGPPDWQTAVPAYVAPHLNPYNQAIQAGTM